MCSAYETDEQIDDLLDGQMVDPTSFGEIRARLAI